MSSPERTPEQERALLRWKAEAKCDVCGRQGIAGVAAMPGVPISFAYCHTCLAAGAHPYEIVVANTAMCGGLEQTAEWWQELVQRTLDYFSKDPADFAADVAEGIARMDEDMRRLEAEERDAPAP
jgi:hypothetical protein